MNHAETIAYFERRLTQLSALLLLNARGHSTTALIEEQAAVEAALAILRNQDKVITLEPARCRECPFEHFFVISEQHTCNVLRESHLMADSEFEAATPPEWCPLRIGPALVELRGREEVR